MISELMRCSLLDVLKTHTASGTPFSLQRSLRYAIQFATGMVYLHTHKPPILHRDLKPANLLLDFADTLKVLLPSRPLAPVLTPPALGQCLALQRGPRLTLAPRVQVSDFGLAKLRPSPQTQTASTADEYQPYVMTGETGSYRFMAPEVFRHEAYGRPVDVYSFSLILYYMLDGGPPWPELDGMRAVRAAAMGQERPPVPRHWDAKLSQLLRAAWADDPHVRPSFTAVLEELSAVHLAQFKCTYEDMMKRGAAKGPTGVDAGCSCALM